MAQNHVNTNFYVFNMRPKCRLLVELFFVSKIMCSKFRSSRRNFQLGGM